ncbi:MAG: alpha-isopropylmalate synthase regulatory domain-containing protein, partial [Planctomycetota bacterium]
QGQATVHCEYRGAVLRGRGLSTDIIEASAHAFIDVINQIESKSSAERGEASWASKNPSTSGTTAS